jgi:methylthioribose-1-phosphate isomerase
VEFYNPAFDVTPGDLITAIFTQNGAFAPGELVKSQLKQGL